MNYNSNLHDYDILQHIISLKDSNLYSLQYDISIQDFKIFSLQMRATTYKDTINIVEVRF